MFGCLFFRHLAAGGHDQLRHVTLFEKPCEKKPADTLQEKKEYSKIHVEYSEIHRFLLILTLELLYFFGGNVGYAINIQSKAAAYYQVCNQYGIRHTCWIII